MKKMAIVKRTKISGSGRHTTYKNVPNFEDVRKLRDLGFDATLQNEAPRGGAWGVHIVVPARQEQRALQALAGKHVYASRSLERLHKQFKTNVISRITKVRPTGKSMIAFADELNVKEPGWVDQMTNSSGEIRIVKVKDANRIFSRHELFKQNKPHLVAEARGKIGLWTVLWSGDDRSEEILNLNSNGQVRIYMASGHVYVVGEALDISECQA